MKALLLVLALLGCYSERVDVDLGGDCGRMMGGAARFAATVKVGNKLYGKPTVFPPKCVFHIDVPCPPDAEVKVRVSALDENGRYGQETTLTGRCDGFSHVASTAATAANPPPDARLYAVAGAGDEMVMVGEKKDFVSGFVSTFDGIDFSDVQFLQGSPPVPSPPGPLRHVWFDPPNHRFFAVGDGNLNLAIGTIGTSQGLCPRELSIGGISFAGLFAGRAVLKRTQQPNFAIPTIASLNLAQCQSPGTDQQWAENNVVAFGPSGDCGVWINGSGDWTWVKGSGCDIKKALQTPQASAIAFTNEYGCIVKNNKLECPYNNGTAAPPIPIDSGFINLFTAQRALIGLKAPDQLVVCPIGGSSCTAPLTVVQGIKGLWASAHALWLVGDLGVIRYDLNMLLK